VRRGHSHHRMLRFHKCTASVARLDLRACMSHARTRAAPHQRRSSLRQPASQACTKLRLCQWLLPFMAIWRLASGSLRCLTSTRLWPAWRCMTSFALLSCTPTAVSAQVHLRQLLRSCCPVLSAPQVQARLPVAQQHCRRRRLRTGTHRLSTASCLAELWSKT
jgi:hypothetical protein